MKIPQEAFTAQLTDYQFRLLVVLCRFSGSRGRFKASIEALGRETDKKSDKTVRRALKELEKQGLIKTSPTRRANGFNSLLMIEIQDSNYRAEEDSNYRTSHDYVTNSPRSQSTNKPLVPNSQNSNQLKELRNTEGVSLKEVKVPMKNYDDGDDLAGFGLIEPKDAPTQKISKRDPKTRGKRPEHEWTPMDVAAEFSYRVGRKYPLLPGTVSVKQLSGALAKFRKQYDTNALIELELLRLFMADERNFQNIGDEAPMLYKMFLASFGKKMNQARENLGLNKINAPIDTAVKMGTLQASDGRTFQNSLSGRAQLARYEKRLKENANG